MVMKLNAIFEQQQATITALQKSTFSDGLMEWAADGRNLRSFTWRETTAPYEVLIAELLLRRTNARAAEPIYAEFLETYPTLESFRVAERQQLYSLAAKAGLRWRAQNLVTLSNHFRMRSDIPVDVFELQQLPGVGPYVARAVALNTQNVPCVPIDSNVVRVVCRYFGFPESDSLRRLAAFQKFADELVAQQQPRSFNYALLDFASLVCRPRDPSCSECVLADSCEYRRG
jgi:A/G-specific adenine glycosylase